MNLSPELVKPSVERLAAVKLVRAAAAVLIVHGFLVGGWMHQHGENPGWLAAVREWVNRPLRIGEDFGPLGIMLLLLASGYLACVAADRGEWRGGLVRTYVPVPVATLLTAGALLVGARAWTLPADAAATGPNVLGNLALVSHLVPNKTLLVPLAWVTGLQLVCWLTALAARRAVWPVAVAQLAAVGVLTSLGGAVEHLAVPLCLAPLVIIGQLAWKVRSGALVPWAGLLLGWASLATIVVVDRTQPAIADWWYPVAAVYAVLLFLVAIMVAGPVGHAIAGHPASRWLADRAEWLMLLLGAVGYPVLAALHHRVPLAIAAAAAVFVTGLIADACHRLGRQ